MEKVLKLKLVGLTCAGCAEDIQTVLRNTAGIRDASVAFSEGTLTVTYDPDFIDARGVFRKASSLGFKITMEE